MRFLIYCLAFLSTKQIEAFTARPPLQGRCSSHFQASRSETETTVDALLSALETEERDDAVISRYISDLERWYIPLEDDTRFKPLLGLYEVSYIKTAKTGDNPVGGKWTSRNGLAQKILKTRKTFQHITPTNSTGCGASFVQGGRKVVGEAINVISLEALWGLIRCYVILRGDAIALTTIERVTNVSQPLSSLAVRALFDAPRIVFGKAGRWLNINIGPKSGVLLDASYVDSRIRIGVGGSSGTRFVFKRCAEDDKEANEFRAIISQKPMSKSKALSLVAAMGTLGVIAALLRGMNIIGGITMFASVMLASLLSFSSGGIEQGRIPSTENTVVKI